VLFTAMFSGIAMLWDRQFGFLKETLVAPVPRLMIMIGRTLGGATVAVLQGTLIFVVTLIAGFRPVSLLAVPLAFLVIALIAVIFSALATAIGSSIKEMQGFQMVMNFLVMPLFFLSGAIYPLEGLPRVLGALTRIDPLTYGVDGVRGLLIGRTHFGIALDLAVLSGVGVVFVVCCALRFSKIVAFRGSAHPVPPGSAPRRAEARDRLYHRREHQLPADAHRHPGVQAVGADLRGEGVRLRRSPENVPAVDRHWGSVDRCRGRDVRQTARGPPGRIDRRVLQHRPRDRVHAGSDQHQQL